MFYGTFFARNPDGSLLTNAAGIPQIEKGIQTSATTFTPQRDANGLPTGTTLRKVIGNPNPDYNMSFVNDFTYKRLNLHVQFDQDLSLVLLKVKKLYQVQAFHQNQKQSNN